MHWDLPLCCLGLQQPQLIGPDKEEPPEVALGHEVLPHEPNSFTRPHTREQADKQNPTNVQIILS